MNYVPLLQLLGKQHWCATRAQCLEVMSRRQLDGLLERGFLERVFPQVFVLAGSPDTWHRRAAAAVMSVDGAALSHRSAARLLGVRCVASERISVTVPRGQPSERDGVIVHRSDQLRPWVTVVDGIPVTTPARTMVDLTSCAGPPTLKRALDDMTGRKLVTSPEVQHCLDKMVTKGRRRISWLRVILDNRTAEDDRLETDFEHDVKEAMALVGLPEPCAQRWFVMNGTRYRPDLCYPDLKIALEPDGRVHELPSVAAYDRLRDADFGIEGWIVIRKTLDMEMTDFLERVRTAITRRSALPTNEAC